MERKFYKVALKISDGYKEGGTDSTVQVQLVGENGDVTEWKVLDHWFHDDFEQGSTGKYKVDLLDVGMPCMINIRIKHKDEIDGLVCDFMKIMYEDKEKTFPIYTHIKNDYTALDPETTTLENVTNKYVRAQRQQNLRELKKLVKWNRDDNSIHSGIMNCVECRNYADLPEHLKNFDFRLKEFKNAAMYSGMHGYFQMFLSKMKPIETLDDYHKYYRFLDKLKSEEFNYEDWKTDEFFGWQTLNGVLPLGFKVVKKIPTYFNVTDSDVKHLLGSGKSLEGEIKAEKLFICDYTEILSDKNGLVYNKNADGTPCQVAQSICLFYINDKQKFVPICIQLKPNDRNYLFTADENSHDWLLAKMYFSNSKFGVHEMVYHYMYSHGFLEPFQVASMRCLSTSHPIYKLLRPHLRTVICINQSAREKLLPPTSPMNKGQSIGPSIAKYFYKSFDFAEMNIPKVLQKDGVAPNKIPHYYFANDMMKLWKIIENYVSSIVNIYYKSEKDVLEDSELQEFAHEAAYEGFGWQDGNIRGIPSKFESRQQLIELLTVVIATSSAQHSAVNFGQWDHYKFTPMNPGIMNLPPHKKGEGSMERILKSLPDIKQSAGTIVAFYATTLYYSDQDYLGEVPEELFFEENAVNVLKKFQEDLKNLDKELEARNKTISREYVYQMPRNVTNSVAI